VGARQGSDRRITLPPRSSAQISTVRSIASLRSDAARTVRPDSCAGVDSQAFYRGRHYSEHLCFTTHVFVLTVERFAECTRSNPAIAVAQLVDALVIIAYVSMALRRVYGGSWRATIASA
jgi:hypothetical protein